jgi:hypothetical protein
MQFLVPGEQVKPVREQRTRMIRCQATGVAHSSVITEVRPSKQTGGALATNKVRYRTYHHVEP